MPATTSLLNGTQSLRVPTSLPKKQQGFHCCVTGAPFTFPWFMGITTMALFHSCCSSTSNKQARIHIPGNRQARTLPRCTGSRHQLLVLNGPIISGNCRSKTALTLNGTSFSGSNASCLLQGRPSAGILFQKK